MYISLVIIANMLVVRTHHHSDGPHNTSASAVMSYLNPGTKDGAIVLQSPMMKGIIDLYRSP